MDMFTVITPSGRIVCQSRLREVAASYVVPGTVLLRNGEPVTEPDETPAPTAVPA